MNLRFSIAAVLFVSTLGGVANATFRTRGGNFAESDAFFGVAEVANATFRTRGGNYRPVTLSVETASGALSRSGVPDRRTDVTLSVPTASGALDAAAAPAFALGPLADTGYGPEYRFTRAIVLGATPSNRVLVIERFASPNADWQNWLASAQALGASDSFTLTIGSPGARLSITDVRPHSIREYIARDASGQEQLIEQMTLTARRGETHFGMPALDAASKDAMPALDAASKSKDAEQANIRHPDLVKFTENTGDINNVDVTHGIVSWGTMDVTQGILSWGTMDAASGNLVVSLSEPTSVEVPNLVITVSDDTMQNLQENVETATRFAVFQFNLQKGVRDSWPSGR